MEENSLNARYQECVDYSYLVQIRKYVIVLIYINYYNYIQIKYDFFILIGL